MNLASTAMPDPPAAPPHVPRPAPAPSDGPASDRHAESVAALAALAHPARLSLYRHLAGAAPASATTRALAQAFDLDMERAAQHLALLAKAGLLRAERRDGQVIHVRVAGALEALTAHLEGGRVGAED